MVRETQKSFPGLMAAIFFLTVIMAYICYNASQSASKYALRRMKWINFLYIIFTLILGIIGFATMPTVTSTSLTGVWSSLTQYEKIYFSSSIDNLVSTFQTNLLLFGILYDHTCNSMHCSYFSQCSNLIRTYKMAGDPQSNLALLLHRVNTNFLGCTLKLFARTICEI